MSVANDARKHCENSVLTQLPFLYKVAGVCAFGPGSLGQLKELPASKVFLQLFMRQGVS